MNKLFTPVSIGRLTLHNRIVMAPIDNGLAMIGGGVNDDARAFMRRRAEGGASLLMSGGITVSPEGRVSPRQMCLYNEAVLFGMQQLVDVVHGAGAKIGAQLAHGGRQTGYKIARRQPVAPSPVFSPAFDSLPLEMQPEDFERIRNDFAVAARRAEELGFDLIELQMDGGYLLHSFLSPRTNLRTDGYGGPLENRLRYPLQVLAAVRQAVSLPLTVRLCVEEGVPGSLPFEEVRRLCAAVEEAGVEGISLSAGSYDSPEIMFPPMFQPPGQLMEPARALKQTTGLPLLVGGRMDRPALMEEVLDGCADLVLLGRALIADPHLPHKLLAGEAAEVCPCVACNQGCLESVAEGGGVTCMTNPCAGYERHRHISPAASPKRVVVIGGGPGGLMAARTAAARGHTVALLEGGRLGGMLNVLSTLPDMEDYKRYNEFLQQGLGDVDIALLETELEKADDLVAFAPDAVVVAAGARQAIPPFPVKNDADLEMAEDVLARRVPTGDVVVVVGGGRVGINTAKLLCSEGKKVFIVEMKSAMGEALGISIRRHELDYLASRAVEWWLGHEVMAVEQGRVLLEKDAIECDTVVVALGYYPNIGCAQPVKNRYDEVYVVGDAKEPRGIQCAVAEGFDAGCRL